jgi:nucleotide-binding universal stress UspA family protein
MKNILVPIDFSVNSTSAVKTAAFLAQNLNAQIHLLHVVAGTSEWMKLPVKVQQEYPEIETKMTESRIRLEKFSKQSFLDGMNPMLYIKTGTPYEEITAHAKSKKIDLIVMGAHGIGESINVFIGSTAQKVLRTASCPVLSVKKDFKPSSIKKILFTSDFEEIIQDALNTVSKFADRLKAAIDLAFVNTPVDFSDNDTIEGRMQKFLPSGRGAKYTKLIYNDFDKETGILKIAKKQSANIIAMVTHYRKGKPGYLIGITESLLFHADVPVLSITLSK